MRLAAAFVLLAASTAVAQQGDQFEPNQTRRTASPLRPGDYKALYCNQEDWYAVEVPAGQRLEISLQFEQAKGDLELEITDPRGKLIGWSRGTQNEEAAAVAPRAAGTVFVRVHGADAAYDLHVGLAATGMGPPSAEGFAGRSTCWGADWYPIEVQAGKHVKVDLDFKHAEGDLDLALLSEEGTELAASSGQNDAEGLRWSAAQNGTVLLQVKHVHRGRAPYGLRVTLGAAAASDLARVFRVERPDGKGNDLLELRSGDPLVGEVLDAGFRLATAYADLELPIERVAGIDLDRRGSEVQGVMTVDEELLSGFVRIDAFRVKVAGFAQPVRIPLERVARVIFGKRGNERRPPREGDVLVALANGDQFRGKVLATAGWTLDLGFATLPLDLSQVESIGFEPGGHVNLVRADRTVARGRLGAEALEVELAAGKEPVKIKLHPDRLSMVQRTATSPGRLGPAELRQLVRQLGVANPPRELLRELDREGGVTQERVEQLRALVPVSDAGAPALERHVVNLEERGLQYAWFEVLVRCDRRLRERLVKVAGSATEERRLRMACAGVLVEMSKATGNYQSVDLAAADREACDVFLQVAMAQGPTNDDQTTQRMIQAMRGGFRGGRGEAPQPKDKELLMEQLPRILSER